MREAIFILLVLVVVAALTAYRYRRQIGAIIHVWRMLRGMRQKSEPPILDQKRAGPLVNCAKCGIWIPRNRAIALGGTNYCSAKCVETKAKAG
jgi:hypothetical protein